MAGHTPSGQKTWQSMEIPELNGGFKSKITYFYGSFSSTPCLTTDAGHHFPFHIAAGESHGFPPCWDAAIGIFFIWIHGLGWHKKNNRVLSQLKGPILSQKCWMCRFCRITSTKLLKMHKHAGHLLHSYGTWTIYNVNPWLINPWLINRGVPQKIIIGH